jgi:transposase
MQVDNRSDTIKNISSYYGVNSKKLQRHYKHKVSGFKQWEQLGHAEDYLIYPENVTDKLSIDEVSLSKGELYTFVTNKNTDCKNKKSVVAVINGTEASSIYDVLNKIPLHIRQTVKEVTLDMARNMSLAVDKSFPGCSKVIDRFHAVRLVTDAMQHLRVKHRWEAIEQENKDIKQAKIQGVKHSPFIHSNGDTTKELLARSRYLLYRFEDDWTLNQSKRATILFNLYPQLKIAYKLSLFFRTMYKCKSKHSAILQFKQWKQDVINSGIQEFNTALNSLEYNMESILNFFDNRSTNANAESFNSKIKGFRANLRGVTDVKFFLFRLEKLFA